MLIIKLLRYLKGYVEFIVRSGPVERFLNLCVSRRLPVWDCRKTDGALTGRTTISGYKGMSEFAHKAGVCPKITRRHGLPFLLRRYRKRVGIAAGILLFWGILAVSQQFIWVVRVEGCKNLDPRVLTQALEELGVSRGTPKASVHPSEIRREITLKVDELSWAALNVRGVTATLVVRERTPITPKIDTNVPANVVAAAGGQIYRIEATDGKTLLKPGDTVLPGDIIVSGIIQDRWGATHLLRANARVLAKVDKRIVVKIPLEQKTAELTGRVVKRHYIEVAGIEIPLFIYRGLEGTNKVERMSYYPEIFGVSLPIPISRESHIFYTERLEKISEEMALRLAQQELGRKERELGENVLSRELSAVVESGELVLTGEYTVLENIGKQVEIPVNDRKEQEKPKKPREGGY